MDLHTPYILNSVIANDLEWFWATYQIFNNTKRRAVSLRQLSFLFICPLHSTPPLGDSRRSKPITVQFSLEKLVALPGGRRILRICSTTEYRRVTDGQTDRQTLCDGTVRAMHMRRAVKTSRDIPCDHAYCCTHVSVAVCQSARWSASKMCWERSVTNGSHFRTPPLSI